jgi:hypothetical protein
VTLTGAAEKKIISMMQLIYIIAEDRSEIEEKQQRKEGTPFQQKEPEIENIKRELLTLKNRYMY